MKKKQHGLKGRPGNAMKGKEPRSVRITVRLPPDLARALDMTARARGISRSEAVVRALRKGLS